MRFLLANLLALVLADGLAAQCVSLPGTGCPTSPALSCLTPPRIGTTLQLSSAICLGTTYRLWVVGLPLTTPITLGAPITCSAQICQLGVSPVVLVTLTGAKIQIPLDPGLIGGVVGLQESCVALNNSCLILAGAARVTIMP
jgi:hypothetical protein